MLKLQVGEEAQICEGLLGILMDKANHRQRGRGRSRAFWAMSFGEHYIWGATAGMFANLA